jgi:hypothetical protein
MAGFGGGCLCGQVRYRVAAEPLAALACHCRYCQYVSGGAEANVVVIPSAALSLKSGDQRSYRSIASSGTEAWRAFCPNCGTPLFAGNAKHPEATAVKVGYPRRPRAVQAAGHIWMASAPPWHLVEPGVPTAPMNPEGLLWAEMN